MSPYQKLQGTHFLQLSEGISAPRKGLLASDTLTSTDRSSWRQLLTAASTSTSSVVESRSRISTWIMGTRQRTIPCSPTTSLKAESSLCRSFEAHLISTWRPLEQISLIPQTVIPSSSGLTLLFRLIRMVPQLTSSASLTSTAFVRACLDVSSFLTPGLDSFFWSAFLAGTSIHSSSFFEVLVLFSDFLVTVSCGLQSTSSVVFEVPEWNSALAGGGEEDCDYPRL